MMSADATRAAACTAVPSYWTKYQLYWKKGKKKKEMIDKEMD
jgi:hypothetical protein